MDSFIGKDVSIKLKRDLGTFQGKISFFNACSISIKNPFHNGLKIKKSDAEVTISREEIENISFIQTIKPDDASKTYTSNTPKLQDPEPAESTSAMLKQEKKVVHKSPENFTNKRPYQNQDLIKTKPVPIRKNQVTSNFTASSSSAPPIKSLDQFQQPQRRIKQQQQQQPPKRNNNRNYDLMQPLQDDFSDVDFDFESNNAMFDKKSIFQEIEADIYGKKNDEPDIVRHAQHSRTEQKYRHDENVLDGLFIQFKNIQLEFKPKQEYSTDEPGVIVPSIPQSLRNRIQNLAANHGYSMERQNELLARGATELALLLLGGSRRLSPKNQHQWPRVTIICDEAYNYKQSEIGLMCGRQLASHGVGVNVYVKTSSSSQKESKELELFTATGNDFTGNIKDLTPCDLIILSVSNMNQNSQIIKYIQENRSNVLAIDPPVAMNSSEINIKNAIIPILPLDDIQNTCGKLHLVNLCISEKFYKDAGIKYSPVLFGSRFTIPLYLKS